MRIGRCILLLPTWLIAVQVGWYFYPPTHQWKKRGRRFTLAEWEQGATSTTYDFALGFWLYALAIVFIARYL